MRGTLSAWFLHGVCQHETRRARRLASPVRDRGWAVKALPAVRRCRCSMVNMGAVIRCRLSGRRLLSLKVLRAVWVCGFSRRGYGLTRDTVPAGGHAIKLLSAAWYFSDFVERYRATDHGHDKYMEDGTDTQRTRITASYVRHTRISGSVYDQSRVSTRASPPGASAITPKMQGSHGCPRS